MHILVDGKKTFDIKLYQNSIAKKYVRLLTKTYNGDGNDFDNKRSFQIFKEKKEIIDDLIVAIENINNFLKKEFIKIPKNKEIDNQYFYNELHLAFEKLSGSWDKPTKLFIVAPLHVKESIRDINYCLHLLEATIKTPINERNFRIQWNKNKKVFRTKMTPSDHNNAQFVQNKNEVYLAYNELGKNFLELFHDNLPLNYQNSKNTEHVGLDIVISVKHKDRLWPNEFVKWCKRQGVDPYEKNLGLGLYPIGQAKIFDTSHLTTKSKLDIIF